MKTWFYVVVLTPDGETGYIGHVFGRGRFGFQTYDEAQVASDKLGPGEIVELPVHRLEEAVRMLQESY